MAGTDYQWDIFNIGGNDEWTTDIPLEFQEKVTSYNFTISIASSEPEKYPVKLVVNPKGLTITTFIQCLELIGKHSIPISEPIFLKGEQAFIDQMRATVIETMAAGGVNVLWIETSKITHFENFVTMIKKSPMLRVLDISNATLSSDELKHVIFAVGENKSLMHVNFSNTGMTDLHVQLLSFALMINTKIEHVVLTNNPFGKEGTDAFRAIIGKLGRRVTYKID